MSTDGLPAEQRSVAVTRLMTIAEARKASPAELVAEIVASSRRTGSKRISVDPLVFFDLAETFNPESREDELVVGGDIVVVPR